jgi:hypothetical protein
VLVAQVARSRRLPAPPEVTVSIGQIEVDWDNGRSLALIEVDTFRILPRQKEAL